MWNGEMGEAEWGIMLNGQWSMVGMGTVLVRQVKKF
jgi:hypothetical protein